MADTYSNFVDYVLTFLLRQNDTDLSNNMSKLVRQAEDELDKLTRNFQRRQKTASIAPETQDFDLTTNVPDFQAIHSLTNNAQSTQYNAGPRFEQATINRIYEERTKNPSRLAPFYAVDQDDGTLYLRLAGPFSASSPGDLTMVYRIAVPSYESADASWLEDEYYNLLLYTVLKHCAIFLRDEERVKLYTAMQREHFDAADYDDKYNLQHGGTPMRMQPHRAVP